MVNLADIGARCECGSNRLAPTGDLKLGAVVICAACAGCFRVTVALEGVRWSEIERELAELPYDLQAFEWTRGRVPQLERRTLAELATSAPSRRPERLGVVIAILCAVLFVAAIARVCLAVAS